MTIKQKVLNWCKRPFANHPFAFAQSEEEIAAMEKFNIYKKQFYHGHNLEAYVKFVKNYAKDVFA